MLGLVLNWRKKKKMLVYSVLPVSRIMGFRGLKEI